MGNALRSHKEQKLEDDQCPSERLQMELLFVGVCVCVFGRRAVLLVPVVTAPDE